jgi:hypothetical protein
MEELYNLLKLCLRESGILLLLLKPLGSLVLGTTLKGLTTRRRFETASDPQITTVAHDTSDTKRFPLIDGFSRF